LLGATDRDDVLILGAVLHHHRKDVCIEDERVGVHQEQVVGIDPGQRHVQCFAVGDVTRFFGWGIAFDQVDPVERAQILDAGVCRTVIDHPDRNAGFLDMLLQQFQADPGELRGFVINQNDAERRFGVCIDTAHLRNARRPESVED
jgi:hypothetical protein